MAMPKSKISRSRRGHRRAHDSLDAPTAIRTCETNGELHRAHRAYKSSDGALYFKGKQITNVKSAD